MSVVTRFAPSPTGRLHVGNLRTALHNALLARRAGGRFILRIDDTDQERSEERFVAAIEADLAWLGLHPDATVRQSARGALYDQQFERLVAAGRIYPCYESREELDVRRKVLLSRGLPPVYERKPADAPVPAGVTPHWRFRLDHDRPIAWDDAIRGPQSFDPAHLSDPVVRRADGSWLYMLPSVIDDIDLSITHVLRGEDHVSNSAVQLQMFEALGAAPPVLAHSALLVSGDGKLSKRLGSDGVDALKEAGIEPMALHNVLARIGTAHPVEALADLGQLAAGFDLAGFGRAPAHFDEADVAQVNRRLLHHLDHAAVADRLPAGIGAEEWGILAGNIDRLADLDAWLPVLDGDIEATPVDAGDRAFLAEARALAAPIAWDSAAWPTWTAAVRAATGRSGRALFHPLRRALTGRDSGPEMAPLVARIGKARCLDRLDRVIAAS